MSVQDANIYDSRKHVAAPKLVPGRKEIASVLANARRAALQDDVGLVDAKVFHLVWRDKPPDSTAAEVSFLEFVRGQDVGAVSKPKCNTKGLSGG